MPRPAHLVQLNVPVSQEVRDRYHALAKERGVSLANFITDLIVEETARVKARRNSAGS